MKQLLVIIMAASISLGGCVCLGAGWVYEFDGVDDVVSVPDAPSLAVVSGGGECSMFAWIKMDAINKVQGVIVHREEAGDLDGWRLLINSDNKARHLINGSTSSVPATSAGSTLSAGVWYHIGMTVTGPDSSRTVKYWLDGVEDYSVTANAGAVSDPANSLHVGTDRRGAGNSPFDGQIHDARVYNRATTAAEIRGLYKAGGGRNDFGTLSIVLPRADDQSLVYSLDRPADTYCTGDTVAEVRDASGSGNHGTLEPSVSAGPVWSADGYLFDGSDYISGDILGADVASSAQISVCWREYAAVYSGVSSLSWYLRDNSDGAAGLAAYAYDTSLGDGFRMYWGGNIINENVATDTGWNTFGFVSHSATDHRIYRNGLQVGTSSDSRTIGAGIDAFSLGGDSSAGQYISGSVGYLYVYTSALSSNQVYSLSQGIAPTNTPVLHYPFNAPSYSITSKDASRNYGEAIGGVTVGPAAIATPAP